MAMSPESYRQGSQRTSVRMPSGYGFQNTPKVTPPPAAGQYPGAIPSYGPPRNYGPPPRYPGPPRYEFAPNIDPRSVQQSGQMLSLIQQQQADERAMREAELFQIKSQYHPPRQSRLIMLGGY